MQLLSIGTWRKRRFLVDALVSVAQNNSPKKGDRQTSRESAHRFAKGNFKYQTIGGSLEEMNICCDLKALPMNDVFTLLLAGG